MDIKFRQLIELGAGKFEHASGALIEQLEETRCTLKSLSASATLQDAGLYYVAYDGDDYARCLMQRQNVESIVGQQVEQLIYYYFCCDKDNSFPLLSKHHEPFIYNQFTCKNETISLDMAKDLSELFVAIHIDKALHDTQYKAQNCEQLRTKFKGMEGYLSIAAIRKINQLFDVNN